MNRRLFLLGAAATSAVPRASATDAHGGPRIVAVVYDARYSESRRFASVLTGRGVAELATGAEGLEPWREVRDGRWPRIAGLTTHSDYLVLGDAARMAGLRLLFEGMHDWREDAAGAHRAVVCDPAAGVELNGLGGENWPAELAGRFAGMRGQSPVSAEALGSRGTLFSWMFG